MTEQYSIAEARHDLAAIVRKLERLPFIQITRRGKPVAMLLSIQEFERLASRNVGFWDAYSEFRETSKIAELEIEPALFEGLRQVDEGRTVEL